MPTYTTAGEPVERWRGMNRKTLEDVGEMIDNVNIMAYDSGAEFDEIKTFTAFEKLYTGTINMGFEVGSQGWGTAILGADEAYKNLHFVKKQTVNGGCFVWSYRKDGAPGISVPDLVKMAGSFFIKKPAPAYVKPTYSCPSSVYVLCPNCDNRIKLSVADGGAKV